MASALPGQLRPVRLLGGQWFLSAKLWCPRGRRLCRSWQHLGIAVPGLLCSHTTRWERCKQVSDFAGAPFSLSPSQHFPLRPSDEHPQTQTHSHRTHSHLYRDEHTDTLIPTHARLCALWNTHTQTHTFLNTRSPMLSPSLSRTRTPGLHT